jgi:hypothetical protein
MPRIGVALDEETLSALMKDAERHLRPTDRHVTALLRLSLGLPVPLPKPETPPSDKALSSEGRGR